MWNLNLIVLIYFYIAFTCGFFSVGVGAHPLDNELKRNESLSESEIIDYIDSINFTRNFIHEWTSPEGERYPDPPFIEDDDWLIVKIFKYFLIGLLGLFIVMCVVSWTSAALWYIFLFFRYWFCKILLYVRTKIDDENRRNRRWFNKKWTLPREDQVRGELRALHHTTIIPLFIFIGDFESRSAANVENSEEQSSNQE